ncbi:ABC transporter ATP-binding protein [Pseudorhodoplanes sp.]|uniref:ABC transporter ATP-binding protein n=1 Tax=Pseudorhodoplanes sp. TaxID=1934341 RepID=UPI002CD638F0|nr:ABC transporter ATP-binding protein [Pseudorhodoplanes sp.]HWV54236.1 ABC transporter ATP-binding protein [Pseudorhodoplanes sp.]
MLLEVSNVEAGYGAVPVLRGISMQVAEGEVIAVLGSNGAGKSTLNRVLSGLMPPWSGSVRFAGTDMTGRDAAIMVEAGLVHVPEGRRVFPNLSVRENLELGSYRRGRVNRARNLDHAVGIFPRLKERLRQAAGTLSGGEQQMLAIGRGLMAEPKLLILDEPSLGLSPLLVEEMFGLIERIRADGPGILLVEQNVVQSLAIASRAYMLENGSIVLEGPAATLRDDPQLKKAYLGL